MKKWIFLSLLVGLAIQCQVEDVSIQSPILDGKYEGIVVHSRSNFNRTKYHVDTFYYSLRLKNGRFSRYDCEGNFKLNGNNIRFSDGNCACWCDCNPYVDCGGDITLGASVYDLRKDSLFMTSSGNYGTFDAWYLRKISN